MESFNTRPQRPEEAEVRKHFGEQIPTDAPLMQPDNTSIWALQDGTLLWDWRNGYANIGEPETPENRLKCLMYISGEAGAGKSILIQSLANSTEVNTFEMPGVDDRGAAFTTPYEIHTALEFNRSYEIVAFTSQTHSTEVSRAVENEAQIRGLRFYDISLNRKVETTECSARYALQVMNGNAEEASLRGTIDKLVLTVDHHLQTINSLTWWAKLSDHDRSKLTYMSSEIQGHSGVGYIEELHEYYTKRTTRPKM